MCLITYSKSGKLLPENKFETSIGHNPDGMGVMAFRDGKIIAEKFLTKNKDELYDKYASIAEGHPHALHHRFATHGNKTIDMLHPFKVLNKAKHGTDLWMMHNGVIRGVATPIKGKSDTWHFVHNYLRPVLKKNPRIINEQSFKELLGLAIGDTNKLIFLDDKGTFTLINRNLWSVQEEMVFSNTYSLYGSYRYSNPTNTTFGYTNNNNTSNNHWNNDKKKETSETQLLLATPSVPITTQQSSMVSGSSVKTTGGVYAKTALTHINDLYFYHNPNFLNDDKALNTVSKLLEEAKYKDIEGLVWGNPELCVDLIYQMFSTRLD